jgi:arginase family enzyme
MKDLSIYFESENNGNQYLVDQLGSVVITGDSASYNFIEKKSIAIIYVPEYRNSSLVNLKESWIQDFRHAFYKQFKGNWHTEIHDLGWIKPGHTIEDTYKALQDVISELVKSEVFPLVIGGSQDLTFAMYQAYEKLEQTVNIMAVDPCLDLGDPDDSLKATGWINKILLHKPNYLFNFSLFGYQSYLVNPNELKLLDDLYFDAFRLGDYYANEKIVEPQLRNTDLLSFDMNAIRSSDFKSNQEFLPNGFYGEDACRIMRYAGISDKLTSTGIFNFVPNPLNYQSDINLLAQMIWYFLEGYNQRKQDYPIGLKTDYVKFRVNLDDFRDEVIFYKSDKSGRWWMEVPYPKIKGMKLQRHLLVPCSYEDYENALKNELPNLWLKTYKKLS